MECLCRDEREMMSLGEHLSRVLARGDVVNLVGELGMGKTTLVKGLAAGLGYQGRVTSPTFTLVNIYEGDPDLYHCDFYRLPGEDAEDLGIRDLIGREGIFVIEWPQVVKTEIYPPVLQIGIELAGDDYDGPRRVTLQANNQRGREILEELKQNAAVGH